MITYSNLFSRFIINIFEHSINHNVKYYDVDYSIISPSNPFFFKNEIYYNGKSATFITFDNIADTFPSNFSHFKQKYNLMMKKLDAEYSNNIFFREYLNLNHIYKGVCV